MRLLILALGIIAAGAPRALSSDHVIMVSADGFRPAAIEQLVAAGELPNFARMQAEGVWTHNARTDFDFTFTVPNHVSMVTGRPVNGVDGHNYTSNGTPSFATTLHTVKGSYVSSVFDVAHDHGLSTSVHRSKSKLVIIDKSYNETTGAPDTTGDDDGRAKIDTAEFNETDRQSDVLMDIFVADLMAQPTNLAFLHLVDPDRQGHGSRWETPAYFEAIQRVDDYLGQVIDLVENNAPYAGRTTIIFTTDHGGAGSAHTDQTDPENYTIPFYVWGAGVPASGDLYAINPVSRLEPGGTRPMMSAPMQPIRNGDIGNLALSLLGLPAVPGSTINADHDLRVSVVPQGIPQLAIRKLPTGGVQIRWASDQPGTVQINNGNGWENAPGTWPSTTNYYVDQSPTTPSRFYRVVFAQ